MTGDAERATPELDASDRAAADLEVSVVMSVYNDATRVAVAAQSILDQRDVRLELIVIDDGSTDGTADALAAIADPRLRVVTRENGGLTTALIEGCRLARADVLARQDSDDWSHPRRLRDQLDVLASDDRIGMVSCATTFVGPQGERLETLRRTTDPVVATDRMRRLKEGPPAHGTMLFRRDAYEQAGGYRPAFYYAQDADLWLRMSDRWLIGSVDAVRYVHRVEVSGASGEHRAVQRRFGQLGRDCLQARIEGRPEDEPLAAARRLTAEVIASRRRRSDAATNGPVNGEVNGEVNGKVNGKADDVAKPAPAGRGDAAYLLGSQLLDRGDGRATRYLLQTVQSRPTHWKAWLKLAAASVRPTGGGATLDDLTSRLVHDELRGVDANDVPPLRWLVMANVPPDPNSGAAGTVYATTEALRGLGHEVDSIWDDSLGPRRIGHGNLHSLLEQPRRYRREALRAVREAAAAGRPYDVVMISQPQAYAAAAALRRAGFDGLLVNRSHGVEVRFDAVMPRWHGELGVPISRQPRLSAAFAKLLGRQWKQTARNFDAVIVPSEDDEAFLRETGWFDPPAAASLRVIRHGVSDCLLDDEPVGERPPTLLAVGQAAFCKGPHLLTEIVSEALSQRPDATMRWITPEGEHGWLRERIDPVVRDRVTLQHWVDQAELREAYRAARVFLFPSLFEGFAKAVSEAMAGGCCVVAGRHSGMKDAIDHGRTGWLCENGNVDDYVARTVAMLDDPADAARIGQAAKESVRELTWERTAREMTAFVAAERAKRTKASR